MMKSKFKEKFAGIAMTAVVCLSFSLTVAAETVKINRVRQTISTNPSKTQNSELKIGAEAKNEKSSEAVPSATPTSVTERTSVERLILEEQVDIVEEACDCAPLPEPIVPPSKSFGFPWAVLGLGALPPLFLCCGTDTTTSSTATPTPWATPPVVVITPTPTPPPVPEPMTILLFGTGLAGVGAAARRRMKKNSSGEK